MGRTTGLARALDVEIPAKLNAHSGGKPNGIPMIPNAVGA
jgi:hypothetical protein